MLIYINQHMSRCAYLPYLTDFKLYVLTFSNLNNFFVDDYCILEHYILQVIFWEKIMFFSQYICLWDTFVLLKLFIKV